MTQGKIPRLPTGVDSFRRVRKDGYYYIDKTLMIRDFLDYKNVVTLITRPRRFGKTLNMTTLRDFFDIEQNSRDIFDGLAIMDTEHADQINSRPTLYFTFKSCSGTNVEALKVSIAHVVKEAYYTYAKLLREKLNMDDYAYREFNHILKSFVEMDTFVKDRPKQIDTDSLKRSLLVLIRTLADFYQKPVLLLIDEYDQPLLNAHESGFREQFSKEIYGDFLGDALKGNESLGQSLVTGIQRMAKESIFSKLNNISVYTVVDEIYAPYFGLTEIETQLTLEDNGLSLTDEVKNYYDGYNFGGIEVYNPWSILSYITKKRLDSYWINTSTNLLIRQLILNAKSSFKDDFEELIMDGTVETSANLEASFIELDTPATLWGLLINAGYMTIMEQFGLREYVVRIPNHEVKAEFRSIVELYINITEDQLTPLFSALFNKNMPRFLKLYRKLILNCVSFHDAPSDEENKLAENSFHMLFLGMSMMASGMYRIKSNRETGDGRSDIVMTSLQPTERPHIIIEFKQGENLPKLAQVALDQIFENRYYAELTGKVLCIGIAHSKKRCELIHQEIEVDAYGEIINSL